MMEEEVPSEESFLGAYGSWKSPWQKGKKHVNFVDMEYLNFIPWILRKKEFDLDWNLAKAKMLWMISNRVLMKVSYYWFYGQNANNKKESIKSKSSWAGLR